MSKFYFMHMGDSSLRYRPTRACSHYGWRASTVC